MLQAVADSFGVIERVRASDFVSPDAADAIDQHLRRLDNALNVLEDLPLAIGASKELVEAVAKVVLVSLEEVVDDRADFDKLLSRAHDALARLPGKGLTSDAISRRIASSARAMVAQLAPARNLLGTGHGKASVPAVPDDLVQVCVDASVVWSRWALTRMLEALEVGPSALRRELATATFVRGEFRSRVEDLDVPSLSERSASLLAVSIARAAMRGDRTVGHEGVQMPALSRDLVTWPLAYRVGLVDGLLTDADGRANFSRWSLERVGQLLHNSIGQLDSTFASNVDRVVRLTPGADLYSSATRRELLPALVELGDRSSGETLTAWQRLENFVRSINEPSGDPFALI